MGLLEALVDLVSCLGGCDPVPLPGSRLIVCRRCRRPLAELEHHHVELTGSGGEIE